MVDSWFFSMHGKFKYVPTAFYGRDVASIHIVFDLIDGLLTLSGDFKGGTVMAFIDVLVDIFDGFDRCTNLHIDVTIWGSISLKKQKQKAGTTNHTWHRGKDCEE